MPPEVQRRIVQDYQKGKRGHGYQALANAHQLPASTVQSVVARAKRQGGDPVAPRGHRKRKLSEVEARKLCRAADRNAFATNRALAAVVDNKISEQSVSNYLAREKPCFSMKVVVDQEPEELTEEWKAEARRWLEHVKRIPLSKRIYEDEAAIYANEAPKKGRSRKGKPLFRSRPRNAKKYTLHVYARSDSVIYWDLADVNANTAETDRVAQNAAEVMQKGDTLIWDRLGRSGRAKNPMSQHYSPIALEAFEDHGVKVEFLPPKGKYFNPIELLFNDLKCNFIRRKFPKNGQPLSKTKIKNIIRKYCAERAPRTLPGFFKARANGKHALAQGII